MQLPKRLRDSRPQADCQLRSEFSISNLVRFIVFIVNGTGSAHFMASDFIKPKSLLKLILFIGKCF